MRRLIPAILLLLPAPALAQGFAVRVTPEGVGQLNALARQSVPPSYAVEEFETVVLDCPASDRNVTGHVPATDIALGWHELSFRVEDGRFFVSTTIDIDVATPVDIDNPYACFGEAMCDVTASVRTLGIDVELAAATGPEGGVEFHGTEVDLALTAEDLNMESENCAIGDVALFLFDIFESWALELAIPLLESLISEKLAEAMTSAFDSTLGLTVALGGFTIRGWLDELELSASNGVTVGGDAEITWSGEAAYDAPSPELHDPSGEALPRDFAGQFQLAASDRLVTSALYEAWRGGLIHSLLADQSRPIELGDSGVVQQLGLPAGTTLEISFDIERPLSASFGRETPNVAELALEGLHVVVQLGSPSGEPSTIDVRADGSLRAALAVDASLGGLVLDIVDLDVERLSIEAGDSAVVADRARLRAFIEGTVTPLLAERLAGVPVAPALHPVLGSFVHLRSIESEGGWQRLGADLVLVDPSDLDPPDTSFEDPPSLVAAGTASFLVTGEDASAPQGLLRYRAWLDGEPLNEGVPSSVRAIRADVDGGAHVIEVAAVDLNGNEDPSPARHEFTADGTPPVLTVLEAPQAIHGDRDVHAVWEASDVEGGVASAWELRLIDAEGRANPIMEVELGDHTELEIADLTPGELYELEIVARDEAGNVTSETIGFAIDPNLAGGCAASPARGPRAPRALALFAIFGLALFSRMRRR